MAALEVEFKFCLLGRQKDRISSEDKHNARKKTATKRNKKEEGEARARQHPSQKPARSHTLRSTINQTSLLVL